MLSHLPYSMGWTMQGPTRSNSAQKRIVPPELARAVVMRERRRAMGRMGWRMIVVDGLAGWLVGLGKMKECC